MFHSFKDFMNGFIGVYEEDKTPEETKDIGTPNKIETVSFKYTVNDNDIVYPSIEFSLDEYNEECIDALASLLINMDREDFVIILLSYIEESMSQKKLDKEFVYLLSVLKENSNILDKVKAIEENKEPGQTEERPCIEPEDLI